MIVDAHVHVWRAEANPPPAVATTVPPSVDVAAELLAQYLADHQVDRAVLVQPAFRGEDNAYVADCAARWPERFAAVAVVDPRSAEAPDRLRYWVHERGCRGLRLRPRFADEAASFGQASTFPLWRVAGELGIAVNVLAGPEHLPQVALLAERFPGVPILVDHLAHPRISEGAAAVLDRLTILTPWANVSLKLSGWYYFSDCGWPFDDCRPLIAGLLQAFGTRRLLWGSDFPHVLFRTGYPAARRFLSELWPTEPGLSAAGLAEILGGNAQRLYWGGGAE